MDSVLLQLKRLDVNDDGTVKTTVNNLQIVASIKNKLTGLVLNGDYLASVKDFADAFTNLATLQNAYWAQAETDFKPGPLLREIRTAAITDTVNGLTENGIGVNISGEIATILRTNITAGGSYAKLTKQLSKLLTDNDQSDGLLTKYTRQITTDSINQYNAQYTHAVAAGLDFEWYAYQGSDILTTRPFCWAMTARRYFHVTEIPDLLAAVDLEWTNPKTNKVEPVPIYAKTGLPGGMIDGTNSENFFINRGGYNCGHQIRPVSVDLVPGDIVARVSATPAYIAFQKLAN